MNINCNQIDNLLLEGDRFSMEVVAAHARDCEACMEKLAAWNEISETARSLQASWRSDTLWPRIHRAIEAEKRAHFVNTMWRTAAAVVLTVGIGAGTWYAVRAERQAAFDREILRVSALDDVERAERVHLAAIDQLERLAEPKLEEAQSPLMVSYKEKLMLLDDAIAECQTNINRNRQNAHLRKQLLAIYTEKQRTLEDVLREGNHASNQ
ncbi:MAG TPA: hypothetical protein VGS96_18485 [Thermoanaerobaculia bacterium]|jgi:hypothetical protein|nr:hypothetical protein [Thermoanaerobaculia bacterium]